MKISKKLLSVTVTLACIANIYAGENDAFVRKLTEGEHFIVNRNLPESICGPNDLQHVESYDNRYQNLGFDLAFVDAHQASVGAMKSSASNSAGSYCSGTLISEQLFLTASHCIDSGTTNDVVAFNYQLNATSGVVRNQEFFNIESVLEDGDDNSLDYAILVLQGSPGTRYGWRNVQVQTANEILIIQHPLGEAKQLEAGNDVLSSGNRLTYAQLDTEPGSSGSGVLNNNGNIVAVHTNGGCTSSGGRNSGTSMAAIVDNSSVLPIVNTTGFDSVKLGLAAFGYDAGGWRVANHPRMMADVNGDSLDDVVGFANGGVYTALSNGDGTFATARLGIAAFGYSAGGWRVESHPRMMADVNGDGSADIVGFANGGVYTALSNGNGTFASARLGIAAFGYNAGGWRVESHPRIMSDINGDGRADIVGFANGGVYTALSNGDGTFVPARLGIAAFGYNAGGWRVESHPRMMSDINDDGRADIVGFANGGVYTALSNGDGTFAPARLGIAAFGYNAGGWRVESHPRMISDVNGDGNADIVGFANGGVYTALSNGNGTFSPARLGIAAFGYNAGGWRVENHPRMMADVNSDGRDDIVGFANGGVYTALSNGNGTFSSAQLGVASFGYSAGGWRVENHPRMMADLNGDGSADIVGFANNGVNTALSNR
ncbi:FG-GAP-like repeat-containing protein [Thalassomonas actiniarum]|uniref:Serine protease n=1 Tax=Thalassomonas actiniarum TaxID=485447 RepID=A0AAE9YTB8_9GAMM|nr:FG-GAP-like repeat-containing protein [Thalassomonas actiniarum]WDE00064.1 VCBS repeat-containing protein [Thalassomonas actiniarum]